MTATGHAVIGTVIAATISNPFVAIPLAFVSHLAADSFPHWDSGTHEKEKTKKRIFTEAVIDVLLGFFVSYLLIIFLFPQTNLFYAFIMIIAAQGMDWAWAPEYFFKIKNSISSVFLSLGEIFNNPQDKPWELLIKLSCLFYLLL